MKTDAARRYNRARLLGALISSGRATRGQLASKTALSKPTVSRVVDDLLVEGFVREAPPETTGSRGRHAVPLELVGDRGVACGVDMGATTTRFLLGDLSGRPLAIERRRTPRSMSARSLAAWVVEHVVDLCETSGAPPPWGVAVGVPGVVHPDTGAVRNAPNLPRIEGELFIEALRSQPIPSVLDNDANVALLGEFYFGAARGSRSAAMFTIGTGVGAAVVLEGKLYRGRSGFAGEFGAARSGHGTLTIEDAISGEGLLRAAHDRGIEISSAADVFEARAPAPLRRLRLAAERALLVALTAASAAYEPEVIVLGGGVSASLVPWLGRIQAELERSMPSAPSVVVSQLSDLAGVFGALAQALDIAYVHAGVSLSDLDGAPPIAPEEILAWLEKDG